MSTEIEGPQPFFDDVVNHMAANCRAPIAIIALTKQKRQWISGRDGAKGGEVLPENAFDAQALLGREPAEIADTDALLNFAGQNGPDGGIRAYVCRNLELNGENVGNLYLADTQRREWGDFETSYLERSARLIASHAEARAAIAERDRRITLEHELAEVGELYRTVVSNMTEGVVVVSAEGAIVASNAIARDLLGVNEDQIHGKSPTDPQWKPIREDGAPLPADENPVMLALTRGEPQLGVVAGIDRPAGGRRWLEINSVPIFAVDAQIPHQVATTFRDITEQRAHQAELAAALERAEHAAVSKQQFLANMSHEIRTPLNGVMGLAQALQATRLDDEQKDLLATILQSGSTLMTLLNDVLDLSKIEAGKFEIVPSITDTDEFLRRQLQLWRPRAEVKGLQLALNVDVDLPGSLSFDQVRAQQCLSNLISNAVKFTVSGRIDVFARAERRLDGDYQLEFEITDTGQGMDALTLARLFQPFTQADETTSRSHGGTGLGLSITRKLAELMGGEAWATSEPGRGSSFHISVRASVAKSAPESVSPGTLRLVSKEDLKERNLRILVVDDNAVNRQVAVLFLKPLNAVTVEAVNGSEALKVMEQEPFDLVLLDMHMPILDGPGTISRIRASESEWSGTPVIALTADAMSGDRERYLAMGMDGYISKPLAVRELLTEIGRVLDESGGQHPMAAAG